MILNWKAVKESFKLLYEKGKKNGIVMTSVVDNIFQIANYIPPPPPPEEDNNNRDDTNGFSNNKNEDTSLGDYTPNQRPNAPHMYGRQQQQRHDPRPRSMYNLPKIHKVYKNLTSYYLPHPF